MDIEFPLHYACGRSNTTLEEIRNLCEDSCNLSEIHPEFHSVHRLDPHGCTPLHFACRSHTPSLPIVQFLVESGAKVNQLDTRFQHQMALHQICNNEVLCPQIVEYLVSNGADVNMRSPSTKVTPLHLACGSHKRFPSKQIVEFLVANGADVNAVCSAKHYTGKVTPLHFACDEYMSLPVVEFLVKSGADVNMQDAKGQSSLLRICKQASQSNDASDAIRLLLQHNAKVTEEMFEYPIFVHEYTKAM